MQRLFFPIILLFVACDLFDFLDKIEIEYGKVTGKILQENSNSTIYLEESGDTLITLPDENGVFTFDSVEPDLYLLKILSPDYGRFDTVITVKENKTTDIGKIRLTNYPFPIMKIIPGNNAQNVKLFKRPKIRIFFTEPVDIQSVTDNMVFTPSLLITRFLHNDSDYLFIESVLKANMTYSIELTDGILTQSGQPIAFNYTHTFHTEDFKIKSVNGPYGPRGSFEIGFNTEIDLSQAQQAITLSQQIPYMLKTGESSSYYTLQVKPTICWKSDDSVTFRIDSGFKNFHGATLKGDTTFSFVIDPLQIHRTTPADGATEINPEAKIVIEFNSTIREDSFVPALSINPAINYSSSFDISYGNSKAIIIPDSLHLNTSYTVSIDTTLAGYFGTLLSKSYSFSFKTRK